jgi:hypothetical protein
MKELLSAANDGADKENVARAKIMAVGSIRFIVALSGLALGNMGEFLPALSRIERQNSLLFIGQFR